ncbi:serine/threonine-protein phosphatase with EF-hands 2 [Tachysurus fulvidraco]|uniref:serine/threonine-protein phosphatase with EF-hands 2 n=1 Tax=Tachysurus fulvidraco TaxID=1234273 RepID=UPI001FEEBF0A|nr:serine/threonine-protein phosphatase with EF-hands 2 [Tachysurus fulvidraco]
MGCGVTKGGQFHKTHDKDGNVIFVRISAIKAAVLIQRWYRQYVSRMEMRRRYTWNIFQSIEYTGLQDQIKLYNFLGYLMDNFTPSSNERKLISHIFRDNEICRDAEWERYFSYSNIDVPEIYSGPRLTFPLDANQAADLVEAFKNKQQLHSRYVLQLLLETWKLLKGLPNINRISTCHSKEITICGDLHGQLEDLLLIFYKNGMPSMEKPYVFNGDFVDRGKDSIEILLILFVFLLVYPGEVYLNRGNHEDHIINLRYGFTKEVLGKYKMHGKQILKLLQKIFSWLPLATVIDQKVLIVHGGISDSTDLALVARMHRHKYVSALRPPKKKSTVSMRSSVSKMEDESLNSKHSILSRRATFTNYRPLPSRETFQCRSLQDFSTTVARTMEEELKIQQKQTSIAQPGSSLTYKHCSISTSSESARESINTRDDVNNEWKEILDLLWSDPMTEDGCIPNEVRGGGCYWGPSVTEDFLNKHNLQLIIRSHECKQDGYEFCHNRKVLTIFSASNYYEVGSNRGAVVRLGPDLVPYFIQYQTNSKTREMSFGQSIRRTEHSALKVLREQLFTHKSDLISAFQEYDKKKTGLISLNDWSSVVGQVLHLELPWRLLRSQLLTNTTNDMLDYHNWFRNLAVKETSCEYIEQTLLETLYRHRSTLETIFRIVDTDNSGLISFEDFCQTWKLLSAYLKMEISTEAINDLVVSIDMNKDGYIDIDEFMESFRLVDKNIRKPEEQDLPQEG